MWSDVVKREVVALAVVVTTTLGGLHVQQASAAEAKARPRVPAVAVAKKLDPVEAMFAYGDLLDAVQYQAGFEPDARDAKATAASCDALLATQAPRDELVSVAAPIVRFCQSGDDAESVADAFVAYREKVFELTD